MDIDEEYFDALSTMVTAGGVTKDEIEAVEKELGVVFPPPYHQFLSQYGACMGTGFDLAGIFKDSSKEKPPMWRSVRLMTNQLRRVSRGALPEHLIPVSDDGQGTTFYIDTKSEEARILAYGPGVDCHMIATSFREFVVKGSRGEF